jgi:exonuclease VII large subunit
MSLSESFDPDSLQEYLPPQPSWFANASLSSISAEGNAEVTEVSPPYIHWQEHLLPFSCVSQEDNLTVLRLELETAHQLLQHQQAVINTLSEQLTNRDLTLQHTQDERTMLQQACHQQTSQLTEMSAICRDLKMQLKRQQQRVLQYRDLLKTAQSIHTEPSPIGSGLTDGVISFEYDAISIETHSRSAAPKSPPVSAWSAPDSIDLTGPLACYRELATIRMTTARIRLEAKPFQPTLQTSPPILPSAPTISRKSETQTSSVASAMTVELPSFTKTSS